MTTLAASFPMYELPQTRAPLDVLWKHVARRLRQAGVAGVPAVLRHGEECRRLWADPDLLLSQSCGADVVNRYAGKLVPVATPRYNAPGCQGCYYSSVVLVAGDSTATRAEHLRGSVCVVNSLESHSGANALRALVAPESRKGRFFSRVRTSGSHAGSIAALVQRRADVAAIDCVTYALLDRYRPSCLAGTRRLCYTARAPGIPFVTRAGSTEHVVRQLQHALVDSFEEDEVRAAGEAVFIEGVEVLPPATYGQIAGFERYAAERGYPELA